MGAVLAFPPVYRNYTNEFDDWKRPNASALSDQMKTVIARHEKSWEKKLKENMDTPLIMIVERSDEVHPGLFIGSYSSVLDENLEKHDIDVVLNMARECDYMLHRPGTQLIKIGIEDGCLSNCGFFEKAADVIADARRNGSRVLVHCAAGVSRSSTAVMAYLMIHEDYGWADALEYLREGRPCVNPHPLLVRSLIRDLGGKFVA